MAAPPEFEKIAERRTATKRHDGHAASQSPAHLLLDRSLAMDRTLPRQILWLRIGMDLGFGGLGPLFPDNTFEYVPIPEHPTRACCRSIRFSEIPARSGGTLDHFVPTRYRDAAAHYDPEFATFTYGDPAKNKRGQLLRLARGDLLVFYAGLRSPEQRRGSKLYLIGYFTVAEVYDVPPSKPWPPPGLRHLWANAHFRRDRPDEGLVVVQGLPEASRLLDKAVPVSDEQQKVLNELGETLGMQGSLKRAGAGRWVPVDRIQPASQWVLSQ